MKKILFYDDAPTFGGHEVTAVDLAKYLVTYTELHIFFVISEANTRLYERLTLLNQAGANIEIRLINYMWKGLWQNISTLLSYNQKSKIKGLIKNINPDLVVAVQGTIYISSLALVAANECGYRTISYLPLAQPISVTGVRSLFLYLVTKYLYQLPNSFVTTSSSTRTKILNWGVAHHKVAVAFYGLDPNLYKIQNRSESRKQLKLSDKEYAIGIIGRVQFIQKAHDLLLKAIYEHPSELANITWLVVGDGPDLNFLKHAIDDKSLNHTIRLIPWLNDLSYIYAALDMLIIPSRLEGLPIVMLEAMYYGLPIVASNLDGMAEVLPSEWLFNSGDSSSLVQTVLKVKNMDNSNLIAKNKLQIMQESNFKNFGQNFCKVIGMDTVD